MRRVKLNVRQTEEKEKLSRLLYEECKNRGCITAKQTELAERLGTLDQYICVEVLKLKEEGLIMAERRGCGATTYYITDKMREKYR